MVKRLLISAVAVLFVASVGFASAQKKTMAKDKMAKEKTFSGVITDSECGAKGAEKGAAHADCANKCVKEKGAKFALYDTSTKKLYTLDPQDQAAEHVTHHVKVKGTLDGDTLHVTSISMADKKAMEKSMK